MVPKRNASYISLKHVVFSLIYKHTFNIIWFYILWSRDRYTTCTITLQWFMMIYYYSHNLFLIILCSYIQSLNKCLLTFYYMNDCPRQRGYKREKRYTKDSALMKLKIIMKSDQSLRWMKTESDQEINTTDTREKYATTICRTGSWQWSWLLPESEEQQESQCFCSRVRAGVE